MTEARVKDAAFMARFKPMMDELWEEFRLAPLLGSLMDHAGICKRHGFDPDEVMPFVARLLERRALLKLAEGKDKP